MKCKVTDLLRRSRSFQDDSRGTTAVEFAFIAPVLILFVFGVIEIGLMLWTQNDLEYAVDAASRCAVVNKTDCGSAAQVQQYALRQFSGHATADTFQVSQQSCGQQITANLPYTLIIPLMGAFFPTVRLSATTCRYNT